VTAAGVTAVGVIAVRVTAIPSSGETCPTLARGVWLHASLARLSKLR
jgi:hypothetical protein